MRNVVGGAVKEAKSSLHKLVEISSCSPDESKTGSYYIGACKIDSQENSIGNIMLTGKKFSTMTHDSYFDNKRSYKGQAI